NSSCPQTRTHHFPPHHHPSRIQREPLRRRPVASSETAGNQTSGQSQSHGFRTYPASTCSMSSLEEGDCTPVTTFSYSLPRTPAMHALRPPLEEQMRRPIHQQGNQDQIGAQVNHAPAAVDLVKERPPRPVHIRFGPPAIIHRHNDPGRN